MKSFKKVLALGAVLAVSSSVAFATPVVGSIAISAPSGGSDFFNQTGITFTPDAGNVTFANGTLAQFYTTPVPTSVSLSNLTFANAAGTVLFSEGSALSYTINSATVVFDTYSAANVASGAPMFLDVQGTGIFNEAGYDATPGIFSLTSSSAGVVNFEIVGTATSVTPEPNSLVLMGTGLLAAAGMLFMRRRNADNLI